MSRPRKEPTTTRPIRIPIKLNDDLKDINVSKVCGQFLDYQVNNKLSQKKIDYILNTLRRKAANEEDQKRQKSILNIVDVLAVLLGIGNDSEPPKKPA
jgi:hypothetical protein